MRTDTRAGPPAPVMHTPLATSTAPTAKKAHGAHDPETTPQATTG